MAAIGGLSTTGLNFGGLVTGIDSSKIIDGLTALGQQRIDQLKQRQATVETKQAAYTGLQTRLAGLQLAANKLARSAGGAFDGRTAGVSDATAATAVAGTAAVPGTYTFSVESLAAAHQVASAGFADPNARLKTGTLSIQAGGGTPITVTLTDQNNTLQGLADAVNAAGGDAKAAVINDGSAAPYRLLLTSTKAGTANALSVTNNLTAGTGAAINPAAQTLQAASDAVVKLGSGAGALTVTGTGNQLTALVPGVSLTLLKADPGKPVTLTVANDTAAATDAVKGFVEAFNGLQDFVAERATFDPKTGDTGPLFGEREVRAVQDDLAQALTGGVAGLTGRAARLSSAGLSLGGDGKLTLDEAALSRALSGEDGNPADLKRLFGLTGSAAGGGLEFAIGTNKTKPSGAAPFGVTVTAPATRATATAANAVAGPVTITGANNALTLSLNGQSPLTVTLDAGTYTPADLAAQVQLKVNAAAAASRASVAVAVGGDGKLQVTSQAFGTASRVAVTGGSALASLGFAGTETGVGTDVAGSFTVNGQTEAAVGNGQLLTGSAGNANTDGLAVRFTGSAPGTGTVSVTQGLASRLNAVIGRYLDGPAARLKTAADGFQTDLTGIQTQVTKLTDALQTQKDLLTQRFAAMESAVSSLKNVGASLASLIPKASY